MNARTPGLGLSLAYRAVFGKVHHFTRAICAIKEVVQEPVIGDFIIELVASGIRQVQ